MSKEFAALEKIRLEIARRIKKFLPQNRRGGYLNIALDQYDSERSTSSEPNKKVSELIKKNSTFSEPE